MPIADFIREMGFRHDYLADRLGMSATHFSRIATGRQSLTIKRIYDLAAAMRLPVRDVAAAVIPEINIQESANATGTQAGKRNGGRKRCAAAINGASERANE